MIRKKIIDKLELYRAFLKLREFNGCKNVVLNLICEERQPELKIKHPERYIKDYNQKDSDAIHCLQESFTIDEIEQMKAYFRSIRDLNDDAFSYEEVKLPISNDLYPIGGLFAGGLQDFIDLYKHPNYPLKFKISGYYDLRGYENTVP